MKRADTPLSDDDLARQIRTALDVLPDAPEAWQQSAIALFTRASVAPIVQAVARDALNRLLAVLSFDSWATPALAPAMRSLRDPTRHLLFSADGRDIDLRIAPAAGAFLLTGQILGPDESGTVELAPDEAKAGAARVARLDALGEFALDGIRPGRYVMTLRLVDDQIVLPPVDVGE